MRASLRQVLFRSATGLDLNFAGGAFSLNNTRSGAVAAIPGWSFSRTDTNGTATALDLAGNVIQFPSRTNLILQSQTFDDASWTKSQSIITANAIVAPDGSTTADALVASTTASGDHFCSQSGMVVAASTNSTAQFFVKAGAVSWAYISVFNQLSVGVRRFFQLTGAGTVGSAENFNGGVDAATPTIRALSDGWYVITLSLTGSSSQTSVSARVGSANADLGRAYAAADTVTPQIYLWGAQLETGSTATAYIPTTTAAVTVVLPRITNRGILVEEARTNSLRRSDPTSATVGVIGSGGVLPTGWSAATPTGLTAEIVSKGTENGAAYIDFRFSGTNTSGATGYPGVFFESSTQVAALTGQTWAASAAVKLVSGSLPNVNLTIYEYNAAGSFLTNSASTVTLTGSLVRGSHTRTLSNALTAYTSASIVFAVLNNGASLDATVRIALPQLELGAFATSPIITTGAAGTRGGEFVNVGSAVLPLEGTIFASYVVPATAVGNATRPYVWVTQETGNNRFALRAGDPPGAAGDSTRPAFIVGDGSALSQLNGTSLSSGTTAKTASSYSTLSANAALAVNGVDQTVARQLYAAATSQSFQLGQILGGAFLNSYIARLQIIPRFLSAAERIALTAP